MRLAARSMRLPQRALLRRSAGTDDDLQLCRRRNSLRESYRQDFHKRPVAGVQPVILRDGPVRRRTLSLLHACEWRTQGAHHRPHRADGRGDDERRGGEVRLY